MLKSYYFIVQNIIDNTFHFAFSFKPKIEMYK